MNTKKNLFTIDFVKKTIVGTKASFNKAGKGFGAEYEELATKIAAHPDYVLVEKAQKSKSTKKKITYNGLNFELMEDFIAIQKNADQLAKEYAAVKKMAKNSGSKVYPITKKWFLGKFEQFDVETAKTMISDYRIAQAEKSVAESEIIVNEDNQPANSGISQNQPRERNIIMEKYTIDFTNKTLTISAKFSEKLQDIDSEEFALYERFMATIPGLTVIRRTHKTPSKYKTKSGEVFSCNQFKNLKYENMEHFISALPDNEEYFREYTFIKHYASKVQTNGYALVRKWFVAQFPEFRKNPLFYLYNRPVIISGAEFIEQENEAA